MGFGGRSPPKPISFPHPLAELVIPQRSKESTGCGQRGWFSHYNTSPSHPPWRSLSFRSEARNLLHVGRGGGSRITIPLLSSPSLVELVIPQRSKESVGCGQRGWFSHYNTSPSPLPWRSIPFRSCRAHRSLLALYKPFPTTEVVRADPLLRCGMTWSGRAN